MSAKGVGIAGWLAAGGATWVGWKLWSRLDLLGQANEQLQNALATQREQRKLEAAQWARQLQERQQLESGLREAVVSKTRQLDAERTRAAAAEARAKELEARLQELNKAPEAAPA